VPIYFLKESKNIPSEKWGKKYKGIYYILISAGMRFWNKKKFRYGIPVYTGLFRTLHKSGPIFSF
jgi:hypothetical protein